MALHKPPPYFPQGALNPPDEGRYRKFKLLVAAAILFLVLLLAGFGWGVWALIKHLN
jgi:hypothetical protein